MGMIERMTGKVRVTKRPRGGGAGRDAYIPPDPTPAAGVAPPSPAQRYTEIGVPPPRPLVWTASDADGGSYWSTPVANGAGLRMWRDLRAATKQTQLYPLLTGEAAIPSSWHLTKGQAEHTSGEVADVFVHSQRLAAAAGMRTRLEPASEEHLQADLAGGYLTLVPGTQGWRLPYTLRLDGLGGWSADQHAAVLRDWATRFAAEPAAITADSIELLVARPPRDHDAAYGLAEEMAAYCPDLIASGTRTLWRAATTIAPSPSWTFRWLSVV